jgi:hypothetical protein
LWEFDYEYDSAFTFPLTPALQPGAADRVVISRFDGFLYFEELLKQFLS